jgi:hypothetical protein
MHIQLIVLVPFSLIWCYLGLEHLLSVIYTLELFHNFFLYKTNPAIGFKISSFNIGE